MEIDQNSSVICFGETLWDVFPGEKKPGGAPMNVAVHLKQFGIQPKLISRIGTDEPGMELLEFIKSKELTVEFIQHDKKQPTGAVNVEIGTSGDAKYDIVFPSAWDYIAYPSAYSERDYVLIFGSLASRNATSRETLMKLLDKARLALFDVNFRAPHYTRELIDQLLHKSDIVKLNEDEIKIIGEWHGLQNESLQQMCDYLTSAYALDLIVITLGSDGAFVYKEGNVYRHPGFSVDVVDTVGSGDSFLASYLAHHIHGKTVDQCLEMACATGAYVATKNGAVPGYKVSDIMELITAHD